MTAKQLLLFDLLYLAVLAVVAAVTRANTRRIGGALAGGAAAGVAGLCIIVLGERAGWWHFTISWEPFPLALLEIGFALSAFVFLVTWRIAHRFGARGLWIALAVAAVIGPPRDYWYMRTFPEWGSYAPGIAPILAISATYVVLGVVGHGVMRLIAGPASQGK